MRKLMNRKHKGNPSIIKILLLCLMLVLGTSLVSCGSSDTQQEVDEETQEILDDMEDNTLSDEEIASAFEDELVPLDEDEQDLMENSSGDASLEDDEMTALNESDMEDEEDSSDGSGGIQVTEDGTYTSKDEVAVYIHQFGHLPSNYITKNEARDLGWESSEGNLDEVAPGMSIGGDVFGNYEGMLPEEDGRTYRECDIDFDGGYRNSKRIIYSNDGLIFYTGDHYETFEQLY